MFVSLTATTIALSCHSVPVAHSHRCSVLSFCSRRSRPSSLCSAAMFCYFVRPAVRLRITTCRFTYNCVLSAFGV
ncbi:hypothetical protein SESBI_40816 [Sesbania bispinosa]|nr:hypothetical protein SESBI_40816 [Sesbania bispinosa]